MIQVYKTKNEINFMVSGKTYQDITEWTSSVDEMVFREQLATGRFGNNIELDPDTLALMRHVEKQGGILPYYGLGGSSGVCTYRFRVTTSRIQLTVEHGTTHRVMSLDTPLEISEKSASMKGRRFKFSPFPHLIKEKLPQEWSGESRKHLFAR